MDLLDEFHEAQAGKRIVRCSVTELLKQLDDDERVAVEKAIDDHSIMGTTISEVLKARGHKLGADAVRRHRRKVCSCER